MIDYLIVGGGLSGCVVASRLKEKDPSSSVVILEMGSNEHDNPLVTEPMATFQLFNSQYNHNYNTVPQKAYDGRKVYNASGRMLSGSSACNMAMWTRGDKADYDLWGTLVGDGRWSYKGQLPYMKRAEHHYDPAADPAIHGLEGPIYTTPVDREYPLKDPLRKAYERLGIFANPDLNSGSPNGYSPYIENWKSGKRQPAGQAYNLDGVEVRTSVQVARIILGMDGGTGRLTAKGAELTGGEEVMASREVILACGAIRSPQILMLSGIGPSEELSKHKINTILDMPGVGQNFFDHPSVSMFFKVQNPEQGLCAGSPAFHARDPKYANGMPVDWIVLEHAPVEELQKALQEDGDTSDDHPLLTGPHNPVEFVVVYAPTEAPLTDLNIPFDGTCITAAALNLLPTSRGSIKLASSNPADDPLIDPNYFATNVDRAVIRRGMRRVLAAMETPEMMAIVDSEVTPQGYPSVNSKSTDEELDTRVRRVASTWYHYAGSCSMGQVVDTDLRVKGVDHLRIVDASVFPIPLAAHLQYPTYALAEQAAEIIGSK